MNIQPTNEKIDRIFERYNTAGSPGCALAVMKDGEILYRQGYGLADLEHHVPITPSTVFNIGSISKQFTAFAIALLEADGKLCLDDDIRKYLPEMHDFGETITIRNLLHHTSGLRDTFPELLALAEWRNGDVTLTEDVFWLLRNQRELNFHPGEEFMYANSNYVLLAIICERASGQPFAAFSQERIFKPLEMTNTLVNDAVDKIIPWRAGRYYDDEQGGWIHAILADAVVGPTNVHTNVEDLAKWDENFYTGRVGGPAILARMAQPGRLNDGTATEYAFGLEVGPSHQHRGWQVVEHGGEHGAHSSFMLRLPECHLSVVVLFNHFLWDTRTYAVKVADVILDGMEPAQNAGTQAPADETPAPVQLSAEQLTKKAGVYFNTRRAALRKVTCEAGKLQYQGMDLTPLSENEFFFEEMPNTRIEFSAAKDGALTGLKLIAAYGVYEYERIDVIPLSPGELAQYAGRYYSSELDITWTLAAQNDHLVTQCRKYVDSKLTPVSRDFFDADWKPLMSYPEKFLVVFERDAVDRITGFRVSGNSVRRLKFVRQ
jgi:CubicO group peptidase (beta-lactamase class C family)